MNRLYGDNPKRLAQLIFKEELIGGRFGEADFFGPMADFRVRIKEYLCKDLNDYNP